MQWNQIKTLLILSFLTLDVFLFMQFLEKKEEADIGILEQNMSTIEEQLADDKITYVRLPSDEYEETFISVKQRIFSEEEFETKPISQDINILQKNFIISNVNTKTEIKPDATVEQIMDVFHQLVNFSEEYSYWNWNEEENIIYFFQNKFNRPIYYNENGLVMIFLDDKNQISHYTQTMLGDTEQLAEKRKLMKPMQAIEMLYRANELQEGDHIDNVKIGFHTRVPFDTDVQVFVPIWKINVNNEKDYFINAIEGFTFSTNEKEFLEGSIEAAYKKLQSHRGKNETLEMIQVQLKEKVDEQSG